MIKYVCDRCGDESRFMGLALELGGNVLKPFHLCSNCKKRLMYFLREILHADEVAAEIAQDKEMQARFPGSITV